MIDILIIGIGTLYMIFILYVIWSVKKIKEHDELLQKLANQQKKFNIDGFLINPKSKEK